MRIIVTTIYDGVDKEWLEWYCKELEQSRSIPQIQSAKALRNGQGYQFTSTDPEDTRISAMTSYRVEK